MSEIPKAPIVRIMKANGAEMINEEAKDKVLEATEAYAAKLSEAAVDIAKNAGRKTVKAEDVDVAVKHFYCIE